LPSDPLEAWGVIVELLERHSRRLAANLYRARLVRLDDGTQALKAVLGLESGSFEHQQLSGTGVMEELAEYLTRKLGKTARLVLQADEPGTKASAFPTQAGTAATAPPEKTPEPSSAPAAPRSDSQAPSESASAPVPEPAPEPTQAPPASDKAPPRSLKDRDEQWRREERARKKKEALSHPAVKDTAEILEGSIKEVRVLE
jgi:hypothetical protein